MPVYGASLIVMIVISVGHQFGRRQTALVSVLVLDVSLIHVGLLLIIEYVMLYVGLQASDLRCSVCLDGHGAAVMTP